MLQIFTVLDNIFGQWSLLKKEQCISLVTLELRLTHQGVSHSFSLSLPTHCFFFSLEQVVEGKQVSDNSHQRGTVQFSPFHLGNSRCQWRSGTRLSFPMSAAADVPSTEPLEQVSLSKEKRGGHQSLVFKTEQSGYKCAM